MFGLIRSFAGLVVIALLVYVGLFVPLGERTLWEHIKAISQTSESQKFIDGVKDKAGDILVKSKEEKKSEQQSDQFTKEERTELKKLIRERLSNREKKKQEPALQKQKIKS